VTNYTIGILERRVVSIRQGGRISGARSRAFNIKTQEVVPRPARPRSIAIGIRGRIAGQPTRGVEYARVRVIRSQATTDIGAKLPGLLVTGRFVKAGESFHGRHLPLVYIPVLARKFSLRPVGQGQLWVDHGVVGRQDFGIGEFIFHHVRNQLQGLPCHTPADALD
jgi:hypothetical protein